MPRIKDLTGYKCNKLTVICDDGTRELSTRSVKWKCLCDCGKIVYVNGTILLKGKQQSCGCVLKGLIKHIKHGHTSKNKLSKTYESWANMKQRCLNPNNHKYKNYGLRGITICDEWVNSFDNFLKDMGEKPNGLTLERIDVNKGYFKENCCWANATAQANNKTSNRIIEFNNKSMTTAQWAEYLGISFTTLRMRLHRNWSIERALSC